MSNRTDSPPTLESTEEDPVNQAGDFHQQFLESLNLADHLPPTDPRQAMFRKFNQIQAAERASGLDRINAQFRIVHDLAKRTQNLAFLKATGSPVTQDAVNQGMLGEEEMAVNVGDTIHVHGTNEQPSSKSIAGPLAALAAAMFLGPAAAVGLNSLLNKDPRPAIVDTDTDTNTKTIIRPDDQP